MSQRLAVVGAGTMGHGIAQLFAHHGWEAVLIARKRESLDRARTQIENNLSLLAQHGAGPGDGVAAVLGRISATTDLSEGLARADLVFEAIPESPDAKREIYREIGKSAPEKALVASTTSGLNIFELAPDFPGPRRLIIAHFWNPPYLVPLVEVVLGPETGKETADAMMAILKALGGTPVLIRKCIPGFIGVRLASALFRECGSLIQDGVTNAEGIDAVMREGISLRFPILDPMQVPDFGGLDTFRLVWESIFPEISAAKEVPPVVSDMVDGGDLGLKSGKGFYDYAGHSRQDLLRERDEKLLLWLKERNRYRLSMFADRDSSSSVDGGQDAHPTD
ncbi:MAG TPA: 3-hydroxyacyl-CoA dehydrogenase NAD-binding domain-containing protein [Nitrospinota bacterium]|nr:3-hydroxyacyl-CoA dehydrogenase NAD-binding domain-containing protein [Nitrospinota bacterium]